MRCFLTMRTRILVVLLIAGVLGPGLAAIPQEPAPWFGAWTLNAEKSTARPGPVEYKRTRLRIEPWPDGARVAYDMVGTRGGRTHIEWIGAFDGRDHPVQGLDYVLTNAYMQIDDRTYRIVVKVDGRIAATTNVTVTSDGRTLTAVTTEQDAGGETLTTTAVYDRR